MTTVQNRPVRSGFDTATTTSAPPAPAPGPVCTAESNRVEQAERSFATASSGLGEESIRDRTHALKPHQSLEVTCKSSGVAEIALKGEARLKITHREDGQYEVEIFNAFGIGAGVKSANATAGVAAGTKFVVATPEAAADLTQAIASLTVVGAARTTSLGPFVALGDCVTGTSADALERLGHYAKNLASVQGDLRIAAEGELGGHDPVKGFTGTKTEAKAEGVASKELKVDLENRQVTTSSVLEGKAEAEGTLDLTPGGAIAGQFNSRFGGKAEVKVVLRYEERVALPTALEAKVRAGTMGPLELAKAVATLPMTRVLVAEVEVEGKVMAMGNGSAKAKLKTEIPIEPGKILDRALAGHQDALVRPLLDAKWEVEGEVGLGVEMKLGVEGKAFGASVEGSATQWTGGQKHLGSFSECVDAAVQHFQDATSMPALLASQKLRGT